MSLRPWLVLVLAATLSPVQAQQSNGFDLQAAAVETDEILRGTVRDGIPAIDRPDFLAADQAEFLRPEDRVLGLELGGVARAYPISILNWHEIVNDRVGGVPVVVSYCPLCGTGMAYLATVKDRPLTFGVSGLLYNSDMLLFDRQTESLWSQLLSHAVTGPMKGEKLQALPLSHTTWADWRERHPRTVVLSRPVGHGRDYDRTPYPGYENSDEVWFPLSHQSRRHAPKEPVLGVIVGGQAKSYPFVALAGAPVPLRDRLGGQDIMVRFDAPHRAAAVFDEHGNEIPSVIAYWFAWHAFHPQAPVYEAPAIDPDNS